MTHDCCQRNEHRPESSIEPRRRSRRRPYRTYPWSSGNDPSRRYRATHRVARTLANPRRDPWSGIDRDGRRQRRRRLRHVHAGGPELRHDVAVDVDAPDPGSLRKPGDGGPPRSGVGCRPRSADPRAFRQVLGRVSVIDLFVLNALTIVTEFIGVSLALSYLGFSQFWGVIASAAIVMIAVSTGSFRRFERFAVFLVFASLLLVPVILMVHPPVHQMVRDFLIPKLPEGGKLSEVMLLIIAIVGTTVAPWQLFFSAELHRRQKDHAALHPIRTTGSLDRHRAGDDRRDSDDGILHGDFRGQARVRELYRRAWHRGRIGEIRRTIAGNPVRAGAARREHYWGRSGLARHRLCDRGCAFSASFAASKAAGCQRV